MTDPAKRGSARGVDAVLHTSVATLFSNLVTRPTGRAVRVAIERQIREARGASLSILDFSKVGVIDYSCADEVIAKLLLTYGSPSRPAQAYFMAKGVSEAHRGPIEAVLNHHRILLVALENERTALWGPAPVRLRRAWDDLDRLGQALVDEFAFNRGLQRSTAVAWLRRLVSLRVAVADTEERFFSLPAILDSDLAGRGGGRSLGSAGTD